MKQKIKQVVAIVDPSLFLQFRMEVVRNGIDTTKFIRRAMKLYIKDKSFREQINKIKD